MVENLGPFWYELKLEGVTFGQFVRFFFPFVYKYDEFMG